MWLSYSDLRRNIICSHNFVILNLNPIQKTDFSCEPFRNSFARWRQMMQLGAGGLGSTLQTYLRLPMLGNNVRCFCSKIPFHVIFWKSQTFDFAKRYSCLFIKENVKQILQIKIFPISVFLYKWCCMHVVTGVAKCCRVSKMSKIAKYVVATTRLGTLCFCRLPC